jgi:hypothetical protein
MVRFLIKYKPEIHTNICKYLDKEVKQDQIYQQEGIANRVGLLKEKKINIAGKTWDITAGVRDRFNAMTPHSCYYSIVKEGEIVFTFGSMIDKLPKFTTAIQRLQMLNHVKKDLKKHFGDSILEIKREG